MEWPFFGVLVGRFVSVIAFLEVNYVILSFLFLPERFCKTGCGRSQIIFSNHLLKNPTQLPEQVTES